MMILAIETSCDETSAAVVDYSRGGFTVRSNVVSSQINIHKKFGGVVPEVAARKQLELIIPVIEEALTLAGKQNHKKQNINVLAVTVGPGLQIALSVGVETARTLAAVWKKPVVAVNHLEGHLYSALLPAPSKIQDTRYKIQIDPKFQILNSRFLKFPAIGLIVSGGHTELILLKDYLNYKLLGRTRDDAAGEAYDKVAKLLGLPYPGGPEIDRLARQGNPTAFDFPRGMMQSGDYDFSFSGLKTAVLYKLQDFMKSQKHKNTKAQHQRVRANGRSPLRMTNDCRTNNYKLTTDICASFQAAVVDVLVAKTIRAAKQYRAKTILLGGGVAANSQLRQQLAERCTGVLQYAPTNCKLLIPQTLFTTDNAAMIAAAAALRALKKDFTPWQNLRANPSLELWRTR